MKCCLLANSCKVAIFYATSITKSTRLNSLLDLRQLQREGKVDGRRGRGRQKLKYLDSLCTCLKDKVSPIEHIRASHDRRLWHHMVVNVVEDGTGTLEKERKEG